MGWQKDLVFAMLRSKGFGVDVFLATNDCGSGWAEALKRAYAPWLRALSVISSSRTLRSISISPHLVALVCVGNAALFPLALFTLPHLLVFR